MNTESVVKGPGSDDRPGGSNQLLFIEVGILVFALGLWLGIASFGDSSKHAGPPTLRAGTLLPQPRYLADFDLVDQDGRPFSLANLEGHWTFVSIGYTSCPDICPTTMATYSAVSAGIAKLQPETKPQFLFISVDPERDQPERLAQYVRYFNPAFLGATGEDVQLRALTAQFGVLYVRVEGEATAMGYLMDHSASILLVDPEGRFTAIFGTPHDTALIASDFLAIAANH